MGILLLWWNFNCLVPNFRKFLFILNAIWKFENQMTDLIKMAFWKCKLFFLLFSKTVICYSNPGSHPFISADERQYLESELGQLKRRKNLPPTPWIAILTSIPMMALVCAQIGHDFGFYIMVSDLPKYMSEVLQFSIKDNGIYSSLPYLVMWAVSVSFGFVSDFLIVRSILSITGARKIFTGVAAVVPAVFIVSVGTNWHL